MFYTKQQRFFASFFTTARKEKMPTTSFTKGCQQGLDDVILTGFQIGALIQLSVIMKFNYKINFFYVKY